MSLVERTPTFFPLSTQQAVRSMGGATRLDTMLIVVGIVILLSSIAANVGLVVENQKLAGKIEMLRSGQKTPTGIALPPLRGVDQAGKPTVIDFKNQTHPTVLFVFSPTCPVCAKNWANWNSILASQKALGWRPVFINMGKSMTDQYWKGHGLEQYTTLAQVATDTALTYRFYLTPETIILDDHGKAKNEWIGELTPDVMRSFSQSL